MAPQNAIARKQLNAKTIPPSVPPTIHPSNELREAKDRSTASEIGVSDAVSGVVSVDADWGDAPLAMSESLAVR
ncbi:MAG: hypothetical protein U1A77_05925 [Pirellulales bacterium]